MRAAKGLRAAAAIAGFGAPSQRPTPAGGDARAANQLEHCPRITAWSDGRLAAAPTTAALSEAK